MKVSDIDRSVVLEHAKVAALWSTTGDEDASYENLDEVFTTADVTGEAETKLIEMIDNFLEQAGDLLEKCAMTEEQLGHDIILTANHHGAGFWDRGLGELGRSLTSVAHTLGSYDLYVGDDGKLYAY
jgi:hypothetical protein